MFEAFLRTTSTEGLQPLGSAAQRSFELISSEVRERLGEAHANLFAEPVAARHGDSIDWYAPMPGAAVPLPDLPEADRAALRQRLGALVADIRAESERLAQSRVPDDQRLAEALANAIEVPDEAMVQGVRGADGSLSPVLIHWSWIRDEQAAVRGVLTGMIARPGGSRAVRDAAVAAASAASVRSPANAAPSPVWWWLIVLGWLLLAALLGAILYLTIAPCGVNQGRLVFCPGPDPQVRAELAETGVIDNEVARLERELAQLDRACKPTIPVLPAPAVPLPAFPVPAPEPEPTPTPEPAPVPEPTPAPDPSSVPSEEDRSEIDKRIRERGAERGVLNFVLEWSTIDDIDLYVTCPLGPTISYRNRTDCNATYDLDANVIRNQVITDPAENIVFSELLPGLYQVRAHLRGERTSGPKQVVLHVLRSDGPSQSYTGMVGNGKSEWVTNISISR